MSQAIVIITSLRFLKAIRVVHFPDLTRSVPRRIFPIPAFYMLNLLTSLGATQNLSIPMFTVLRRLGIVMTLALEYVLLSIRPTRLVMFAVAQIILGSTIAAYEDLSFSLIGYLLILVYDFFGACEGKLSVTAVPCFFPRSAPLSFPGSVAFRTVLDCNSTLPGVYVKKKLDDQASLGHVGVLYYSVL